MIGEDFYVTGSYLGLMDPKRKEAPIEPSSVFYTIIKGSEAYLDAPSNVGKFVDLLQTPLKRDEIILNSLGNLATRSLNYTKDFPLNSDVLNRTK